MKDVTPMPGTLNAVFNKVVDARAEKAIVLFTHRDRVNPETEAISIQFTSGLDFKDWSAILVSLQGFIQKEFFDERK